MKILLLGATGRTGKHVLTKALDNGHEVICLARNGSRIKTRKNLIVVEGNPKNKQDLLQASLGCLAVISTLNISRTSDFPWSKLRTEKKYLSQVMQTLLAVAEQNKIPRIVICSAWGVSETKKDLPAWFNWFIDHSNIRFAYEDHERQEALLMQSTFDWTIVRPVGLTNSTKPQKILEVFDDATKPNLTISRQGLGAYLAEVLGQKELIGKKVVVSKA